MMNFHLWAQGIHHVIIKVPDIIYYDGLGQAMSIDDVMFDEAGYWRFYQICKRGNLYQFGKIINSHKDKSRPVGSLWVNHTNRVNAPYRERSWACHTVQQSRAS